MPGCPTALTKVDGVRALATSSVDEERRLPELRLAADQPSQLHEFFDPYYKQVQPRVGLAYALSQKIALSAGYSISNPPPVMIFGGGVSTFGYNGSIAVNQSTRPTQFSQDPVMYLSSSSRIFRARCRTATPRWRIARARA